MVVAALVVAGAVSALAVLVSSSGRNGAKGPPPTATEPTTAVGIQAVSVFMANQRPPDNPQDTRFAHDSDPATYWPSDEYPDAHFGNLYPGIGLAIHLDAAERGRHLVVTSPFGGWSAQAFVSSAPVESGQSVAAWGNPTDSKSAIAAGSVSFALGNRGAQWVLLWITQLGPAHQARIAELAIR